MSVKKSEWHFRPIDARVNRSDFACGNADLDEYIKKYARQNERTRISNTFIVTPSDHLEKLAGYYSLCMAHVAFEEIPDEHTHAMPKYPIPTARLARLAVDKQFQGKGLGGMLLFDALKRTISAARLIAAHSLIVDAVDEAACQFYDHHGFIRYSNKPIKLFLPLETAERILV